MYQSYRSAFATNFIKKISNGDNFLRSFRRMFNRKFYFCASTCKSITIYFKINPIKWTPTNSPLNTLHFTFCQVKTERKSTNNSNTVDVWTVAGFVQIRMAYGLNMHCKATDSTLSVYLFTKGFPLQLWNKSFILCGYGRIAIKWSCVFMAFSPDVYGSNIQQKGLHAKYSLLNKIYIWNEING